MWQHERYAGEGLRVWILEHLSWGTTRTAGFQCWLQCKVVILHLTNHVLSLCPWIPLAIKPSEANRCNWNLAFIQCDYYYYFPHTSHIITLHMTSCIITLLLCDYYCIPLNISLKSVNLEFCSDAYPHMAYLYHTTLKDSPHFHFKNEQKEVIRAQWQCGVMLASLFTWCWGHGPQLALGQSLFRSDPTCRLENEPWPTGSPDRQSPHPWDPDTHKHSPGRAAQADDKGWRKGGELPELPLLSHPPWASQVRRRGRCNSTFCPTFPTVGAMRVTFAV